MMQQHTTDTLHEHRSANSNENDGCGSPSNMVKVRGRARHNHHAAALEFVGTYVVFFGLVLRAWARANTQQEATHRGGDGTTCASHHSIR